MWFESRQWDTQLLDVSFKGALLAIPSDFTVDEGSDMRVQLNLDGADFPIDLEVKLIRKGELDLGVAITQLSIDAMTELRRLVELNLGDEALLTRELGQLAS